jgi:cytochrome c biogenesis protein CcmG/thiol:disulfide interchange protein DsbE
MRRLLLPGLFIAVAIALLALLTFGISSQGANTSLDNQLSRGIHPRLPNAQMTLPVLGSSHTESLADFRGKVLVVNVFASWCGPCRIEAPILAREQQLLAKHGGTIVGVTYQDSAPDAEAFVRQEHISYPVLRDVSGNLVRAWGVNGVPETFVLNRAGRLVALRREQLAGTWLAQAIAPLLNQPA